MLYMRHTSTLLYNMDIRDGAIPVSVVILMIINSINISNVIIIAGTTLLIGLLIGNTSSIVIAL